MSKRAKQTTSKSTTSPIPLPFTKAPASLEPFTERLDPAKVYLTHIDRLHPDAKKQIFLIPVLLNGGIAVLLLWRIYTAVPMYWAILLTLLGYASAATVDTARTTRNEQLWILARRTLMFLVDFLLFRFVGPWPLTFFFERPANPVTWRWKLGFRQEEVVVRVSRSWGTEELMKGVKQGSGNAFFKTRIMPAIEKQNMRRTGYLLMDKSWDLDFELMTDAHTMASQSDAKIKFDGIDHYVFAFLDGTGWLCWQWEMNDDIIEERRKKVVLFKEKLTKMGKESLFWSWMEIIEDERDADGGFTPERQKKVASRVQSAFEKEGVDFEQVMGSVGGIEELPVKDR